jgi:hypothetical protein
MNMLVNAHGLLDAGICALSQLRTLEIGEHLPSFAFGSISTLCSLEELSLHICDEGRDINWPPAFIPLESSQLTSLAICGGGTISVRSCLRVFPST